MKYYGDLVFSTGEYEKDGEKKKRWSKAGAVFQRDDGRMSIKFEAMPVGDWSGWMNIFEKHDESNQSKQENRPINDEPIDLSKIPF